MNSGASHGICEYVEPLAFSILVMYEQGVLSDPAWQISDKLSIREGKIWEERGLNKNVTPWV